MGGREDSGKALWWVGAQEIERSHAPELGEGTAGWTQDKQASLPPRTSCLFWDHQEPLSIPLRGGQWDPNLERLFLIEWRTNGAHQKGPAVQRDSGLPWQGQ
jgi:hypothetical protein